MKRLIACAVLCAFSVGAQTAPEPPPPPPEDASAPPQSLPPEAVPYATDQLPPPGTAWSLRVHLSSNNPRVELRRAGPKGELVCRAPCDEVVRFEPSDTFVLGGPALSWSDPFNFRPRNGEVTLKVEATYQSVRTAGKVLVLLGSGAAVGAAIAWDAMAAGCFNRDGEGPCPSTSSVGVAQGVIAGGVAGAVVGAIILLASPPTRFTVVQ